MRITYTTSFDAVCPVNGRPDRYDLTIVSSNTIRAEDIVEYLATVDGFQEDITKRIAYRFQGTDVRTVGTHSGVRTVAETRYHP